MAVNLSPVGGVAAQFFDNSGNVLTGGKLLTYAAGTTTPQVTYTTSAGNIPQSNPIILNASGRVPGSGEIWLADGLLYKFVLTDSNDVLIATYDNINGINSNFVAFTNQQEIQTATAGQTVFNLTTVAYQPGTNSLSVFVDGVNQYGPGAQYAYYETDQDTVTFVNGLHVGALVKFTTSQLNSSGGSQTAAQTSFTGFKGQVGNVQNLADDDGSDWIGFEPAGTGAVARSAQDKMRETVSIKDFGAVGNGIADDTAAIQAALDSGAYQIVAPPGVYVTGPLTIPDWVELTGETYPIGIAGGVGLVTFQFNLTSGTAITCGDNPVIRNILFRNTGGTYNDTTDVLSGTTATCIQTNNNVTIDECSFYFWQVCINIGGSPYYCKTTRVAFNRCTYGYLNDTIATYNFNINEPFSAKTDIFFSGTASCLPRNIKVFGGSIEGYSKIATYFTDISFFGTYFETVATKAGAFAIDPIATGCSVSLYGCLVYMNHTARFVNLSGLENCMLTSLGNVFDGIGPASSAVFYLPNKPGNVHLSGDKFGLGHSNSCVYVTPTNSIGNFNINMPDIGSGNTIGVYSHAFSCGQQGMVMNALTAEPTNKLSGMMVLANGVSWDPLSRAAGRPYWTVWQGDRWFSISG